MERELKEYLEKNFSKLATTKEMNEKISGLRTEMKADISSLRAEMKEEVSGLRTEMKDMEDHVLHQYHITAEALRDDIKQVAEGVLNLNEKFGREMSQFRKEVAHSHDELKAMIKFSYSELDRRITALEIELENIKHRIEKIERGSSIS